MNHLSFFNFTDEPFRLTPDRDFYYPSAVHTAVGEVIRFGLHQGEGYIIVIGEVGTGKTMLLRILTAELAKEYETAFLFSPHLSPKELLLAILRDIGIEEKIDAGASLDHLLRILNDHLYGLSQCNKRLVIIIDEAQNLPMESIEQLRLLSNFEADKYKLLQIILVGQPELMEKVERSDLRQLLQRITIFERLNPLSEKESLQYVHFRLNRAGRSDLRLDRGAGKVLWRYTQGVPRLINKLMSRAILMAYARQQQKFDKAVLKDAAKSLRLPKKRPWFAHPALPWLTAATLAVVLGLVAFVLRHDLPAIDTAVLARLTGR
ncbi:MAG: AAA family ATPase [Desulfobacteraceae bacterium]|nr:AAA family ATPase [Desulfobacteraceae bacterium]